MQNCVIIRRMLNIHPSSMLAIAFSLVFCSPALADGVARPQRSMAQIPFVIEPKLGMTTQAKLNDHTSVTFLIDTGSYVNYIDAGIAAKLGLPLENVTSTITGQPYTELGQAAHAVRIHSVVAGGVNFANAVFLVEPKARLPRSVTVQADGIIGLNALQQSALQIDFKQHQLTLYPGGDLSVADLEAAGFTGAVTLPLFFLPATASFAARVHIVSGLLTADEDLLVDTGANATTITAAVASQLQLVPFGKGGNAIAGFNYSIPVNWAKIPKLSIGGLVVEDYPVFYPMKDVAVVPGSLGLDLLSGYGLLLDIPQKKLYLKSAAMSTPIRITPHP